MVLIAKDKTTKTLSLAINTMFYITEKVLLLDVNTSMLWYLFKYVVFKYM